MSSLIQANAAYSSNYSANPKKIVQTQNSWPDSPPVSPEVP